MIRFHYRLVQEWPPLAWLAECIVSEHVITVFHGSMVEVRDTWFCEAVWDGEYDVGGFDSTDLIFGSGGRARDEYATFVSSGSTVDRLQAFPFEDGFLVSNSLVCLLAVTDAKLDTAYTKNYMMQFMSIRNGLKKYERMLNLSSGSVKLTYFNNLKWNGETLIEVEKSNVTRDFHTFEKYRDFLESSLGKIAENMSADGRQYPYQMLGTLSSGYDSPTVTVLAQQFGLREVISVKTAAGRKLDHGSEIAKILGMQLTLISRRAWRSRRFPEVPFIASDAMGQDVYFSGAEDKLQGRVLLTGFHGDKVWDKNTENLTPDIVRGDTSGLSLTEYRLLAGFIHLPVPFMGVRQIQEINVISNAPEMVLWDVPGDYSRPICRRIVEGAGVPRGSFGVSKKAVSVLYHSIDSTLSLNSYKDYYRWLYSHSENRQHRRKVSSHITSMLLELCHRPIRDVVRWIFRIERVAPWPLKVVANRIANKLEHLHFQHRKNLFRHTFAWSIEKAKKRYNTYYIRDKRAIRHLTKW
jgi:hypothetical protein